MGARDALPMPDRLLHRGDGRVIALGEGQAERLQGLQDPPLGIGGSLRIGTHEPFSSPPRIIG